MGLSPLEGLNLDILLMGFPPLGITPLMGFLLLGVSPFADRISSIRGLCLYASLMGPSPLEDGDTDLPMGPFSISLRESKPSAMGFSHSESLLCYKDFSLSESPFDVSLTRFFLLENTNTSLRAPLIRPMDG